MQQLLQLDDEEQRMLQLQAKTKTHQQSKTGLNMSMGNSLYNLTGEQLE